MSSAMPTKKTHQSFLYTSDAHIIIDVQAVDNTTVIEPHEIISLVSGVEGTGGFYQGTEVVVLKGQPHDPTYTDASSLALLGISVLREPINAAFVRDQAGDLDLTDHTLYVDTFAGGLRRFPVVISEGLVLVKFWDTVNNQAASLSNTDIGKTVYASITDGGASTTGKAGYATLDTDSTNKIAIGTLLGIHQTGSEYGWIKFEPSRAR